MPYSFFLDNLPQVTRFKKYITDLFLFASSLSRSGTTHPTPKAVLNEMLKYVPPAHFKSVIELGAGTGAFTKVLLQKSITNYLGIENNKKFISILRKKFPTLKFELLSAEIFSKIASKESYTLVASTLPWVFFSKQTRIESLKAIAHCLVKGGSFSTFIFGFGFVNRRYYLFLKEAQNGFTLERRTLMWKYGLPYIILYFIKK